ncbi:MAG: GNAT family N-acetyltransferase [Candidatus Eisenbacteria bacterium]|nr:GNAT family N-acetyltransferase [Candidatus Eisenbacteria bacterium]
MEKRGRAAPEIRIERLEGARETEACARMMAESEPWITLRRGYEGCLALLRSPDREVWVARADGRPVGFAVLVLRGAFVGYLQSLVVEPALRGRGIGTRLLRFAEERILRESPNVFVCVSSFNPGARRLYERLGYREVGTLDDYIVPGHAEILLRKTIGPIASFRPRGGADEEERTAGESEKEE